MCIYAHICSYIYILGNWLMHLWILSKLTLHGGLCVQRWNTKSLEGRIIKCLVFHKHELKPENVQERILGNIVQPN